MELDMDEAEDDGVDPDRDELLDVGSRREFLLAGDLVELRYACIRIFALRIFLTNIDSVLLSVHHKSSQYLYANWRTSPSSTRCREDG
jgi:hypothetical protein